MKASITSCTKVPIFPTEGTLITAMTFLVLFPAFSMNVDGRCDFFYKPSSINIRTGKPVEKSASYLYVQRKDGLERIDTAVCSRRNSAVTRTYTFFSSYELNYRCLCMQRIRYGLQIGSRCVNWSRTQIRRSKVERFEIL